MTTFQMPMLDHSLNFDTGVYPSTFDAEMTLTNHKYQQCIVMPYPTGSDIGIHGVFTIPQNYVGSPVVVIQMVLDGSPANTIGFGFQQLTVANSSTIDTAYEAEDTASNATWTGYADEEVYHLTITVTPTATFTAGNLVFWWLYRDDSVDTTTFNVLAANILFQYADV